MSMMLPSMVIGGWRYWTYGGVVGFSASREATPPPSSRCRPLRSIASATSNRKNAVIWPETTPLTRPCYPAVRGFTEQDPTRYTCVTPCSYPRLDMKARAHLNRSAMRNVLKAVRGVMAIVVLAAIVAPAYAQGDARFSGTVLDQTGAFVPGAMVTVKNQKTGEVRTVTATAEGRYVVPNLKPSVYTITATFGSFQPLEYTDMTLAVGQEFSLDLELRPAGVSETVTVEGRVNTIDLSSARIGANVSEREVQELPVNGRQMSQLLLQAPGSQNAGTGTWQDIRFSGRAVEQNVIKYDGIEGSAIIDASPGNVNGENNTPFKLQASLENVQEFRVESSSYPAEYGTGTGGQVSVITKSGTNGFHGALFEYARRDRFDTRNYFDSTRNVDGSVITTLPKSKLKQDQFGGSIGGPLAR